MRAIELMRLYVLYMDRPEDLTPDERGALSPYSLMDICRMVLDAQEGE